MFCRLQTSEVMSSSQMIVTCLRSTHWESPGSKSWLPLRFIGPRSSLLYILFLPSPEIPHWLVLAFYSPVGVDVPLCRDCKIATPAILDVAGHGLARRFRLLDLSL